MLIVLLVTEFTVKIGLEIDLPAPSKCAAQRELPAPAGTPGRLSPVLWGLRGDPQGFLLLGENKQALEGARGLSGV